MIRDLIQDRALLSPEQVLMVIQGDKITYKVFNIYIYAMMNLIKAFNKKVNRLAINLSSRRHTLSALIACNRLNIIPIVLPLKKYQIPNTNYSKIANVDYELNDSNCIIQLKNKKNNFQYNYEKNSVQCVLFTSGSGLFPKAVELTFDNIYNSAKNWNDIFQFNKEEKYLNILPLHHVSGLSIFFRSIYYNFTQIIYTYNKSELTEYVNRYKINYISLVPKMVKDIINDINLCRAIKKIKLTIIGGDAITKDIYDFLKNNHISSYISYGMTESSSGIAGYFINKSDKYDEGYIGFSHKNVKISLQGKYIALQSKNIMKKYVQGKDCKGKFVTNDIGEIKNSRMYFIGRKKDFIISGGENIYLKTIEDVINCYSIPIQSIVVGYKDKKWGEIPIVLFTSDFNNIAIEDLMSHCNKNLPQHMRPKHIIRINRIPEFNNQIDYKLIDYYITQSMK